MNGSNYYLETRHPWVNAVFVVPLLIVYEGSMAYFGPQSASALRNGADTWLHWMLAQLGLAFWHWPGIILGTSLCFWAWWESSTRPQETVHIIVGMAVECVILAIVLAAVSKVTGPLFERVHLPLSSAPTPQQQLQRIISFLGAGIYEETLFRLLLFSLLFQLLRLGAMHTVVALIIAALVSAVAFAAAHHLGPSGEAFNAFTFLFRATAGVYFALIYQLRGFGVAVGAHASYDILVGVILPLM